MTLLLPLFVSCLMTWLLKSRPKAAKKSLIAACLLEGLPTLGVFLAAYALTVSFNTLVEIRGPNFTRMALASAALPALLIACTAFLSRRLALIGAALVTATLTCLTLADVVYWRFFAALAPLLASASGSLVWDIRESVFSLLEWQDVALVPLLALSLVYGWHARVPPRANLWSTSLGPQPRLSQRHLQGLVLVLTLVGTGGVALDAGLYLNHRYSWKVFESKPTVEMGGFLLAHVRDMARTVRERWQRGPLSDEEQARLFESFDAPPKPRSPKAGALAGEKMNVLLVQMEAVQSWAVDAKIRGVPIMPRLAALKNEALFYSQLWDQTGGSPTSDCEHLVLNSQHPMARGSVAFRRPENDFVTLAHVLKREGYQTFSAHAFRRGMWNRSVLHPNWGFDRSLFRRELGQGTTKWGLSDEAFFERILPELKMLSAPWFGFLITVTTHHPYRYLADEDKVLDVGKLRKSWAGYVHSMHYLDRVLGDFLTALDEAGIRQNTIVVIYGDHDSKLKLKERAMPLVARELGLPVKRVRAIATRSWSEKRIPLFILPPQGSFAPQEIESPGGQIDIGPTVLELMGVGASRSFIGRPLLGRPLLGKQSFVARFDGSAASAEFLFSAGGQETGCWNRDGTTAALSECAVLKAQAQDQVRRSHQVVFHDLAGEIDAIDVVEAP